MVGYARAPRACDDEKRLRLHVVQCERVQLHRGFGVLVVPMLDGWWSKRERKRDGVSPELAAAHSASTQLQSISILVEAISELIATQCRQGSTRPSLIQISSNVPRHLSSEEKFGWTTNEQRVLLDTSFSPYHHPTSDTGLVSKNGSIQHNR